MDKKQIKDRLLELASNEEATKIIRDLIKIPSHWAQSARELPIATHLYDMFKNAGLETELIDVFPGRPNVLAYVRGTGKGKSLMFNGHIDTVPPFGMKEPFKAKMENGKIYGRGAADMKSGVGMMAYAMILIKILNIKLKGDLIYIGVIDEDAASSEGTRYIVKNGPITDYAIIGEPTSLHPVIAHKGCDYFEVTFLGRSVHSSVPQNGINSNYAAAEFITRIENDLIPAYEKMQHKYCTPPTINVGLVQGAAKANMPYLLGETPTFAGIVPDQTKVYIDVRWIPTQTIKGVEKELKDIAGMVQAARPGIKADVKYMDMSRPAMEISPDNPLVQAIQDNSAAYYGKANDVTGATYWGDSGLLYGLAGIPCIMFGPGDIGCAHSDLEWVEVDELKKAAVIYAMTAIDICDIEE